MRRPGETTTTVTISGAWLILALGVIFVIAIAVRSDAQDAKPDGGVTIIDLDRITAADLSCGENQTLRSSRDGLTHSCIDKTPTMCPHCWEEGEQFAWVLRIRDINETTTGRTEPLLIYRCPNRHLYVVDE